MLAFLCMGTEKENAAAGMIREKNDKHNQQHGNPQQGDIVVWRCFNTLLVLLFLNYLRPWSPPNSPQCAQQPDLSCPVFRTGLTH